MCIGCHLQVRYAAPAHMEALQREAEAARLVKASNFKQEKPSLLDRIFRRRNRQIAPTPAPEPSMD